MSLASFYPQIKVAHVAMVACSGSLFLLRGVAVLAGASWPKYLATRIASYSVDTLLLTSALMLLSMFPASYFSNGWLTTKISLLVVYIILGFIALRDATTPYVLRVVFFVLAVLLFITIILTAIHHHPLGTIYQVQKMIE